MSFENLRISRLIVHKLGINSRTHQSAPVMSQALTVLPPAGKETLQRRLTDALADGSECVEVSITDQSQGSTFQRAAMLPAAADSDFIALSQDLTNKLTSAQTNASIKPGLLMVFTGTCGADSGQRVTILLKAENDSGFTTEDGEDGILLHYIENLFLTPAQKLYKIGAFREVSTTSVGQAQRSGDDFEVFVFDHLLKRAAQGPALYFCKTFLGCDTSSNAKQQTRDFFNLTNKFIAQLALSEEDKIDQCGNLTAYLRGTSPHFSALEFADQFFEPKTSDQFRSFLQNNEFPLTAISRDTSLIVSKLKTRRLKFSSEVRITCPSEVFSQVVRIIGINDGWTELLIKGTVEEQT